jgi:hypothetical protein
MIGWLIPLSLASMTFAFLARPQGRPREALEVIAAALLLALAGYAWQGSPGCSPTSQAQCPARPIGAN